MNYNFPSVVASPPISMPPSSAVGYRFNPTNEELIINYLVPKMMGDVSPDILIFPEVHVCKHEPWHLAEKYSNLNSDDQVLYLFCPRDFKYSRSRRSNRKTKAGYWKPTGKKIEVKAKRTKKIVGIKKTLVFYQTATPKDKRTAWIIHEYEIVNDSINSNQAEYVLCKLMKKLDYKTKKGEANHLVASVSVESSCSMASDSENQNSDEVMTDLYQEASPSVDSYLENQNSSKLVSDLAHDQSGSAMASYGETQRSNDLIANSENNLEASNPENYSTELMSPEFSQPTPEQIAKLREILAEFQKCLGSPPQPSAAWSTKETPSYMGFGASVST